MIAEALRPVGIEGAVVSGGAGVVTDKGADCAEALPAASRAATVKEYVVLAESPVIDTVVPLEGAASGLRLIQDRKVIGKVIVTP